MKVLSGLIGTATEIGLSTQIRILRNQSEVRKPLFLEEYLMNAGS